MSILKSIAYRLIAPIARMHFRGKVAVKKIKGSNGLTLAYPQDQHLGFMGKREIEYEFDLQQLVLREIEQGQLIFEIGSNIGQYTLLMAEQTGPSGTIVCVEPDSDNFAFLERNVNDNKLANVILLHKAIGEREGQMEFYKDTVTGGRMSSLLRKHTGNHFQGKTESVSVSTLTALIGEYGTPDLIKVDTEGAETMIFASVPELPITTTYFVEVREETAKEIFTMFRKQGFSIVSLDHHMKPIQSENDLSGFDNWLIKHE